MTRRAMVHPYTGELVTCALYDGPQHWVKYPKHDRGHSECDHCGEVMLECRTCGVYTSCCSCGARHALECPWPL